jgi:hypothetical protein
MPIVNKEKYNSYMKEYRRNKKKDYQMIIRPQLFKKKGYQTIRIYYQMIYIIMKILGNQSL